MQFSLITINYNNAGGLSKTIDSIVGQTANDFEYLVVDGGSTDDSTQIIEQFKKHIYWWISEPDRGIYHAMNKAISQATGDYLLFVNSGDELANSSVIENMQKSLLSDTEIASGGLLLINQQGEVHLTAPTEVTLLYCLQTGLTHPNTLIRKSLFEKYGLYNEENRIVSDWEFFLIAAGLNNCKYQRLDFDVAKFYEDGISSTNKELVNREMHQVIQRLVPTPILLDIQKCQLQEKKLSHPAHRLVEQSIPIRKMLEQIYKVFGKLQLIVRKNAR